MVRVHLTSLRLQGSTRTPLRGDKETGAPPDDRRTRGRKVRRPPVNPCDARPRGPALSVVYRKTGRGREGPWLARTRTRARARRLRVLACNTHNAGAGPRHEARIRSVHRRAMRTSSVVVLASRPRAASNGHRSGGYLMYRRRTRRSTRALTKCCVARSGHSRRRGRPCSG